ncbi:hypothetical protein [Aeromicrobium massiliense]|uniref:hypothetical protein n=1 Tax=Aeromicrobium massiliense TaxID=1464554 RepID=UPI000A5F28E1|nr:hypothetical protein [Aeromicrobium massiliense]
MDRRSVTQQVMKYGPLAAKQLPRLWPLLLESRNRERVTGMLRDLSDKSPAKRLDARLDLTAALAEQIGQEARTPQEREQADAWRDRARNLQRRAEVPVGGVRSRAAHRRSVREQLAALHAEMDAHLGGPA